MGQILSLVDTLHEKNVTRVARHILKTFGTTALSSEIAERVGPTLPALNNWFLIKFIINHHFPTPSLCHLKDPDYVEMVVVRQLMQSRSSPGIQQYLEQDCNGRDC